ncbi:hypothetical protein [Hydrogenimonas sp.]
MELANFQGQAFSGMFIDDGKNLQRLTIGTSIRDKVVTPEIVFML